MYKSFSELEQKVDPTLDYEVEDLQTLEQKNTIINSHMLVVVDIYAKWCQPCRMTEGLYADLAGKYNKPGLCAIVKENYERKLTVPMPNGLPTYKFYFQGRPIGEDIVGADIASVEKRIQQYLQNMPDDRPPSTPSYNKSSVRQNRVGPVGKYEPQIQQQNQGGQYNPYRTG